MSTIKVPEKSAKKLKLTATNIKSVLIKGNKDIAKIRADQRKLADERAQLEATQGREGGLEKKSPLKNIGKKVGKKIGSASKGIFDKVMQVAMPLALAVIVNNFEKITEALQKFYDNNKWIFDIVKTVFTTIGKGFMMLVNLIDGIQQNSEKKKLNEVKKDADALKESKAEVDELESTLKEIQKEVGIDPETGESTESVNEDKGDDQVLSAEGETPPPKMRTLTGEDKRRALEKIEYVKKRNAAIRSHGYGSDELKALEAERFNNLLKIRILKV